jgi:hypothetical protein
MSSVLIVTKASLYSQTKKHHKRTGQNTSQFEELYYIGHYLYLNFKHFHE